MVWQLEARKYDRRLHYSLPATLVHDDGERLHFRVEPGVIIDHRTRGEQLPTRWMSDMFFWRERWYNVYANCSQAGQINHFYCNAGLPPTLTGTTLSFVDLDLDVRIFPDGHYDILDEDEFAAHAVEFGYPPDVQRGARQALEDVLALWRAGAPPFGA